jgi:hypothetical protein
MVRTRGRPVTRCLGAPAAPSPSPPRPSTRLGPCPWCSASGGRLPPGDGASRCRAAAGPGLSRALPPAAPAARRGREGPGYDVSPLVRRRRQPLPQSVAGRARVPQELAQRRSRTLHCSRTLRPQLALQVNIIKRAAGTGRRSAQISSTSRTVRRQP